ncbi:MAG: CYTH domain-containing protein [Cyanobacteriota bacterium]|jgi:adenylate cyclase
MALEIERRFLVTNEGWRDHVVWEAELRQGYLLNREDGLTARVRLQHRLNEEAGAWLTIKAKAEDNAPSHARLEFEYAIPAADALALLGLTPWQVNKKRHGLRLPGGDWVLDVFSDANTPLVIAEVELQHPDDTPSIPSWCGKEVTGLHLLSNAALSQRPLESWSPEDRQALWLD